MLVPGDFPVLPRPRIPEASRPAQPKRPAGIIVSHLRDPGAADVAGEPVDWQRVAQGWKAAYIDTVTRYNAAAAAHNQLLEEFDAEPDPGESDGSDRGPSGMWMWVGGLAAVALGYVLRSMTG